MLHREKVVHIRASLIIEVGVRLIYYIINIRNTRLLIGRVHIVLTRLITSLLAEVRGLVRP